LPEPLNETPPIFLAVVKVADDVAVALFPVHEPDDPLAFPVTFPVNGPENPVAVSKPLDELNARLLPDLGGKSPVAAVTKTGKQVVSDDSSATVIFVTAVAVAALPVHEPEEPDAFPVTFPVSGPLNAVAVKVSELELKVNPEADLGPKSPVAAVTKTGKQVVSLLSSATVIAVAVDEWKKLLAVSIPTFFKTPASEYKSSSASAKPDVISVCPEITLSFNILPSTASACIVAAPPAAMAISPDITTGLKFVPSPIKAAPLVLVFMVISSPLTVKSPEIVALPLTVKVPLEVKVVAVTAGKLAAIFARVTP